MKELQIPSLDGSREFGNRLQQITRLDRLEHRLDVPHVRYVLVQLHELVRQSQDDDPRLWGRFDKVQRRRQVDHVHQHNRDAQQRRLPNLILELVLARHGDVVHPGLTPDALHDTRHVLPRALVHRRVEHDPGLGGQRVELRRIFHEVGIFAAAVDARLPGAHKVQGEEENRAVALVGLEVDVAPHALDDGLGDDQP